MIDNLNIFRLIYLFVVVCMICSSSSWGQGGYWGAFLELPPSASAAAFSNANVTFDPEPSAIMSNPANIYSCYSFSTQSSMENFPLDIKRYSFSMVKVFGNMRLATGFLSHIVYDIPKTSSDGEIIDYLNYGYYASYLGLAYGRSNGCWLCSDGFSTWLWQFSVGLSAKLLFQSLNADTLLGGFGFDIGLSGRYKYFRYGLLTRNVFGLIVDESQIYDIPKAFLFGLGLERCETDWGEISIEINQNRKFVLHAGGQLILRPFSGIRLGISAPLKSNFYDELKFSSGFVIFYKFYMPLEFSYSIQYLFSINNISQSVSISTGTFSP